MRSKRFLAGLLATVMILCGSTAALAAETGSATGDGKLEGSVSKDVFSVVLPTVTEDSLKFTMDPEGLIAKTSAAAYAGKVFEADKTVYFSVSDNDYDYKDTTDEIKIINQSAMDVSVTVEAKVTGSTGVELVADVSGQDKPSLCMQVVDADGANAILATGVKVEATIDAAPEGAYEYSWDAEEGYSYSIKDDISDVAFDDYSFRLKGEVNTNADWSKLTEIAPAVVVKWTIKPAGESTAIDVTGFTKSEEYVAFTKNTAGTMYSYKPSNMAAGNTISSCKLYNKTSGEYIGDVELATTGAFVGSTGTVAVMIAGVKDVAGGTTGSVYAVLDTSYGIIKTTIAY